MPRKKSPTATKSPKNALKVFRGQSLDPNITYVDGVPVPEVLIDMVDAYQKHPFVFSAVNIIATNFAQVTFEFWYQDNTKEWVVDEKHPFRRLLSRPNPYQSGYDLLELSAISLEMTGNCYWALERDPRTNEVSEIYLLPSHMVKVVSTATSPFSRYIYTVDGKEIVYDYKDIIHFQFSNPKSMIYGQGSVLASREEITADLYAMMWNKLFFKNSGMPEAVLETEKILDDNVRKRMMNAWKAMHAGYKNAHRMAILEQGVKYKEVNKNHKDMEFQVQRKMARETIYGAFGVPPAVAGILEYSNYSNMKEQNKIFWQYTMLPKIKKFEATLTNRVQAISFRPLTVVQAQKELIEGLRPDLQVLSVTAKTFVDLGIPLNEVIEKLDLPFDEVEGGDVSRPANALPEPASEPTDDEETPPVVDEEDAKGKSFEKKFIRLMKWKSYDDELRRWEIHLRGVLRSYFKAQRRRVISALVRQTTKGFFGFVKKPVNTLSVNLIFDEKKEVETLKKAVKKPIENIAIAFANRVGKSIGQDIDFHFVDQKAIAWLNNKTVKLSQNVNRFTMESISDEVKSAIEDAVREGWSEGDTIQELTDRIENVYDFADGDRAERIAITESGSASNYGNLEGMKECGIEKKEWLATHDDHTRESHKELDGQIRGADEMFDTINGNKLLFPSDTENAPPEETVNCRCTILPVVDDAN